MIDAEQARIQTNYKKAEIEDDAFEDYVNEMDYQVNKEASEGRNSASISIKLEHEKFKKKLMDMFKKNGFKTKWIPSEPGDSFEPMDYGSDAKIEVNW